MREKEPQFTVTDRRKFTAEGELREGTGQRKQPTAAGCRASRASLRALSQSARAEAVQARVG